MFAWKVKAVAIQLRPTTNWPRPNAQPIEQRRATGSSRGRCNSHRTANATGSSGHSPTGSNANAEAAPMQEGDRGRASFGGVIARSCSDEAIDNRGGLLRCARNDKAADEPCRRSISPFRSTILPPRGAFTASCSAARKAAAPSSGSISISTATRSSPTSRRMQCARARPIRSMARMCRCRISGSCCRWTSGRRWPRG